MSTLKVLKTRIQSVQSTRKITSAMYMVAAAKFRRAQKGYDAAKSYAEALSNTLMYLPISLLNESDNPLINPHVASSHLLIILIAADRGLCGSFNGQLFRRAKEYFTKLQAEKQKFSILPIGKKAFDFVRNKYSQYLFSNTPLLLHTLTSIEIEHLRTYIETAFLEQGFSECKVLYNEYKSPLQQSPCVFPLLPFKAALSDGALNKQETHIPYFVPIESTFLEVFLGQYLQGILGSMLSQTRVGEFAARMTAMDNATKNSDDMINALKLEYNQNRQARITKELIEIISGAEALQKG